MVNRQRWTRTRSSERATFLLPVLARDAFSAFVGFVLHRDWVLLKEKVGIGSRREREKDSSWIDKLPATRGILPWLSVSHRCCLCDYFSSLIWWPTSMSRAVALKNTYRVDIDKKIVRGAPVVLPQAPVSSRCAWPLGSIAKPTTFRRNATLYEQSSCGGVLCLWLWRFASDIWRQALTLGLLIRRMRLPEVRIWFDRCNVHVSETTVRFYFVKKAANFSCQPFMWSEGDVVKTSMSDFTTFDTAHVCLLPMLHLLHGTSKLLCFCTFFWAVFSSNILHSIMIGHRSYPLICKFKRGCACTYTLLYACLFFE